jgi:hypothetical protein
MCPVGICNPMLPKMDLYRPFFRWKKNVGLGFENERNLKKYSTQWKIFM